MSSGYPIYRGAASDLPAYETLDDRLVCWGCRRDGERKIPRHYTESQCCRCGRIILPYGAGPHGALAHPSELGIVYGSEDEK
jgi:hypothetical protein